MTSYNTARHIAIFTFLVYTGVCAGAEATKEPAELGILAIRAKDYARALDHFEKALAEQPDAPYIRHNACTAHQGLAHQLAEAGDLTKAVAQVELGLRVDPNNTAALAQIGDYYLATDKVADAVKHLSLAVSLMPSDSKARFLLGEAYYRQRNRDKARETWAVLLEAEPDWPGLQEKYSAVMREAGEEKASKTKNAEHFQLVYAKNLAEDMRADIMSTLEAAYTATGEKLGGLYPTDTIQVTLLDGAKFPEAVGTPGHVVSLRDGTIRAPFTSKNGRFVSPEALATQLQHEYVHVLLAAHLGAKAPWWFNEGLADTFSREMDGSRRRVLGSAFRSGLAHKLATLESDTFPTTPPERLALAYAQAHATVAYLWQHGGAERMAAFVKNLQSDKRPEEALRTTYKLDYAGLEAEVAKSFS